MVMADRQTNSIWSHLDGDAFEGPMTGAGMDFIPLIHTTWEEWQKRRRKDRQVPAQSSEDRDAADHKEA